MLDIIDILLMDKMPKPIWTVNAMIVAVTLTATILLAQDELDSLRQAAEQGDAAAQYKLGAIYTNGQKVPVDYAEAARWYRLAAEQGLAMAQGALGALYAIGRGVPQDDVEAVRWFRLAAEQGSAGAQGALGGMYMHGRGVPQDDETAHVWFNIAASRSTGEQRNQYVEARDAIAERTTRNQLATAQRRAREWIEASQLFPTNDTTRSTAENPSIDPPAIEYGDESELRGARRAVYVDTGLDLKSRSAVVDVLTADAALEVVDRPQDADVVLILRCRRTGKVSFQATCKGYAMIGNRLVWEFEDTRRTLLERSPPANFARNFLKLIR